MKRSDWNNDIYNKLHSLSEKESDDIHNNTNNINTNINTMKWLNYIGLSSTQPWNTI